MRPSIGQKLLVERKTIVEGSMTAKRLSSVDFVAKRLSGETTFQYSCKNNFNFFSVSFCLPFVCFFHFKGLCHHFYLHLAGKRSKDTLE